LEIENEESWKRLIEDIQRRERIRTGEE